MKRFLLRFLPAGVIGIFFVLFYLPGWLEGFVFPGDMGDGRFNALVSSSWYEVFSGKLALGELRMFYPHNFVLGCSDSSLLNGAAAALLSVLSGFSGMSCQMLVLCGLHLAGAFGWYFYVRCYWSFSRFGALFFVWCSVFGCGTAHLLGHTQFYLLALVPFLAVCVTEYFRSGGRKIRFVWIFSAELLFTLAFFSAYYVAFFFALELLFLAFFAFLHHRIVLKDLHYRAFWSRELYPRLGDAGAAALGLLPAAWLFVRIYLPHLSAGWTWSGIREQLPSWSDLCNTGTANWLWSPLYNTLFPDAAGRLMAWEKDYGFSPPTLILIGIGVWSVLRQWKKRDETSLLLVPLVSALLFSLLLTFRIHDFYGGPWIALWYALPGGRAIRSVMRLWIFVLPWLLLPGVRVLECRMKKRQTCAFLFILLVFLGELHTAGPCFWNKQMAEERIAGIVPPPGVRVFLAVDSSGKRSGSALQLDAVQLAQKYGIFTMNGYSGMNPELWELDNPPPRQLLSLVKRYWGERPAEPLWLYDFSGNCWKRIR